MTKFYAKALMVIAMTFSAIVTNTFTSAAQCLMVQIPLEDRVSSSELVFEGRVLSQQSFWNTEHTHIYTVSQIEVFKNFKGTAPAVVELVTAGGIVLDRMETVNPSLELSSGEVGMFMAIPSSRNLTDNSTVAQFEPFASAQGCAKYDLVDGTANDVFHTYSNIEQDLYAQVTAVTQQPYSVVKQFNLRNQNNSTQMVPAISNFTPTTITAGTLSVLTINGTGFGATRGKVEFRDANTGGYSYTAAQTGNILTWTDTKIEVQAIRRAGTGTIRVTDSNGNAVVSSSTLTVPYAQSSVYDPSELKEYRTKLANVSAGKGISFHFNSSIPSAAKSAFARALSKWRCNTLVNFDISNVLSTSPCDNSDDESMIGFENSGCPLSSGVLGQTSTYTSACYSGGTWNWALNEMDMLFATDVTWNYGPNATPTNQMDFESVALHELGHAHLIAHNNDLTDPMYYALGDGEDIRQLLTNDVTNGTDIMNRSVVAYPCYTSGATVITKINPSSCNITVGIADRDLASTMLSVFPNPSTGNVNFSFKNSSKERAILIYDALGNEVSNINATYQVVNLDLQNLPAGVYFFKITEEDIIIPGKFVLQSN